MSESKTTEARNANAQEHDWNEARFEQLIATSHATTEAHFQLVLDAMDDEPLDVGASRRLPA